MLKHIIVKEVSFIIKVKELAICVIKINSFILLLQVAYASK